MRVLVAYGSKNGGTAGLAEMIGEEIENVGHEAQVQRARDVSDDADVADADAVIVAGALYARRWQPEARRFVERHRALLATKPVWLVSSGPLDDSAPGAAVPDTRQLRRLVRQVGARGYATFGGRLTPHARGAMARRLAKKRAGDWRNRDTVRRWVRAVCADLGPAGVPSTTPWNITLAVAEADAETHATVTVHSGRGDVVGTGHARRNPVDEPEPEIGDELAVARALAAATQGLLARTKTDIENSTHAPVTRLHL